MTIGNKRDESDTDTSDNDSDSGVVTMKCRPDYPKYWPLNSLHDIAYCK